MSSIIIGEELSDFTGRLNARHLAIRRRSFNNTIKAAAKMSEFNSIYSQRIRFQEFVIRDTASTYCFTKIRQAGTDLPRMSFWKGKSWNQNSIIYPCYSILGTE